MNNSCSLASPNQTSTWQVQSNVPHTQTQWIKNNHRIRLSGWFSKGYIQFSWCHLQMNAYPPWNDKNLMLIRCRLTPSHYQFGYKMISSMYHQPPSNPKVCELDHPRTGSKTQADFPSINQSQACKSMKRDQNPSILISSTIYSL